MRVLLTGATGVVGRRLVALLRAAGHEVTAAVRAPDRVAAAERTGATAAVVDLFDAASLPAALEGHDAVVNLATRIPSPSRMAFRRAWRENDRLRGVAAGHLADAAREAGVARFVQESFGPIYEGRGDDWIDEGMPVRTAAYNHSTLAAEAAGVRFAEAGAVGIVLRYALFYGADSEHTRFMIRMVRRGRIAAPGAPEAYQSSIALDDAASATLAALALPSGTYNVCDDEPLTRRDYYGSLATALAVPPPKFLPRPLARLLDRVGEPMARSQRMSNRRLREATGWAPAYPSAREGWAAVVAALPGAAVAHH